MKAGSPPPSSFPLGKRAAVRSPAESAAPSTGSAVSPNPPSPAPPVDATAFQAFSDAKETPAPTPMGPRGGRVFDLMLGHRSAPKPWDPMSRLPPELASRLSGGDRTMIQGAVEELQKQVQAHELSYVPVFGYLSLRKDNHECLGKASQSDVKDGVDTLPATLPGYDVGVVASSVYRGTDEHPGVVAGLNVAEGKETPGVVLKMPLARAEELLAVLIAREFFAEGDLEDSVRPDGTLASNAMYAPKVLPVQVGDREVPALVFTTNADGAKDVRRLFDDDKGVTAGRLAYLMAAQGGFVAPDGVRRGGASADYWQQSYVIARREVGQPVDPMLAQAVELARLLPQAAAVDQIFAQTDPAARLMQAAMLHLFDGAAVPLEVKHRQKPSSLQRAPGAPDDETLARLLQKAQELAAQGVIFV